MLSFFVNNAKLLRSLDSPLLCLHKIQSAYSFRAESEVIELMPD